MSVLLGLPSRNIQYLNIHKEGTLENDFCSVDSRWTTPVIDKLDDYLVAVSRFEVPANRIPMTQKLNDCIRIFRYDPALQGMNIEDWGIQNNHVDIKDLETQQELHEAKLANQITLTAVSDIPKVTYQGDISHRINIPPCYTLYDFLQKLNAQINNALLFNTGLFQVRARSHTNADLSAHQGHLNMYTNSNGTVANDTDPIAFFRIVMDKDFTFKVEMNEIFAREYYIKMSPALFNMLAFKEGTGGDYRQNLPGGRFMASRYVNDPTGQVDNYTFRHAQFPAYIEHLREVEVTDPTQTPIHAVATFNTFTILHDNPLATFIAPMSAADSINRLKSLVFTSSLATSSEALTGGGYRRALTDYTIPIQTTFNYNTETLEGTISENAASEYTYTNPNPSAGRFMQISDPSPLYELKVEVFAKCWDFNTNSFVIEPIPLPLAGTFSMKLVFISRSELHRRHRPDQLKA